MGWPVYTGHRVEPASRGRGPPWMTMTDLIVEISTDLVDSFNYYYQLMIATRNY